MSRIPLNKHLLDWFNSEHSSKYVLEHNGSILLPSVFGDLSLRLEYDDGLYEIILKDPQNKKDEVIFCTTFLNIALTYLCFLITKKINPDYLNKPNNNHIAFTPPKRFIFGSANVNNTKFNRFSFFHQNTLFSGYIRTTHHSDLRVHNHLIQYLNYLEEIINNSSKAGILDL